MHHASGDADQHSQPSGMATVVRHAVLGNTGSIISFRVGVEDAPYLVREFHEKFAEVDLLQLPNYRIYLKLMIDGTPSKSFSAVTLDPTSRPFGSYE